MTGTTSNWKISGTGGVMRAALWARTAARLPPLYVERKLLDTEIVIQIHTSKILPQRFSSHLLLWFFRSPTPILRILRRPRRQQGTGPPERVDSQWKRRHSSHLIHGVSCTTTYLETTYVYTRYWRRNSRLRYCPVSIPLQLQACNFNLPKTTRSAITRLHGRI